MTAHDNKSRYKLAQLLNIAENSNPLLTNTENSKRTVKAVLNEDFDLNYKFTSKYKSRANASSSKYLCELNGKHELKNFEPEKVCTALHILGCSYLNIHSFNRLLERGADFTIKNEFGQTVVHMLIESSAEKYDYYDLTVQHINSVLSAHLKFQNLINPCNNNGVSHFHGACITNHVKAIAWFLDNEIPIEEAVNANAPRYAGYTPLHFAAYFASFEAVKLLVDRGANIEAISTSGFSVIDILTERRLSYFSLMNTPAKKNKHEKVLLKRLADNEKIIKLMLEKQCVSNCGLKSFQIASSLKDLTVAKSLAEQVYDINYTVPMISPICPGFTAAHFAVLNSVKAVKMLVKLGIKLDIADANGVSPLVTCTKNYTTQEIHDILSCSEAWKNVYLSDGKTKLLDFVKATADLKTFKLFLQGKPRNLSVSDNSLILPGFTILHLAVLFSTKIPKNPAKRDERIYSSDIVKECLRRGTDIHVKNSQGQTALHYAFRINRSMILEHLLACLFIEGIENHYDHDNLSYLHIAYFGNRPSELVSKILKKSSPNDAYRGSKIVSHRYNREHIIETGWTPLHILMNSFSLTSQIMDFDCLLRHRAKLHAADIYGLTPIHWLLKHDYSSRFNFRFDGLTTRVFDVLLKKPEDRVVQNLGLSYLHVACICGHENAVKILLHLGSDVNAVIKYDSTTNKALSFLEKYADHTPLHCALKRPDNQKIISLLLRHGADELLPLTDKCLILQDVDVTQIYMRNFWELNDLQNNIEERWGFTELHVACYLKDEDAVSSYLDTEIDVNAKIHAESPIFPGCTPLHLLLNINKSDELEGLRLRDQSLSFTISNIINLLDSCGVDVTIENAAGNTPIHVLYEYEENISNRHLCRSALLNAQRDFNVNPTNNDGVSHFHLACYWHQVEIVEKFLQQGLVDVNRPIDFFAEKHAGCTPLHLAVNHTMPREINDSWTTLLQTVDLLLKRGANVDVKDVDGDMVLHKKAALVPAGISILDKLLSRGADILSENLKGETPLEMWSFTNCYDFMKIFQKHGCQMNSWNRQTGEGYIAKIFLLPNRQLEKYTAFKQWVQTSDAKVIDELGRTAIHNSVAIYKSGYVKKEDFIFAIKSFMQIGIQIDHQDITGRTALHYAVKMGNIAGIKALLRCGTDVNIVDSTGRSAGSYSKKCKIKNIYSGNLVQSIIEHLIKLLHLELEVSEWNLKLVNYVRSQRIYTLPVTPEFLSEVRMTKTMKVGTTSFTVYHFLSDTHALSAYPLLLESTRSEIDNYFKSIDVEQFSELIDVIELQLNKARTRLALISNAMYSLSVHLGFSFPGLREEITRYLTNSDLKNLIASVETTRNDS